MTWNAKGPNIVRLNSSLLRATLSGALGGLLFGFDTVVISGAIDALVRLYGLNPQEKGFTVAIGLVGTVIGALGAGQVGGSGSAVARRCASPPCFTSSRHWGCGLAWNWPAFMAFRFIGGLGIGASSVLAPVYIAELAPAKLRGRLVASFQLNVVFGVMAAYHLQLPFSHHAPGPAEWRLQVGIAAVPALVFLALLFGIPRSPRWSVTQNRMDEALSVLKMMGDPDPQAELAEIQTALAQEHATAHERVFQWKYRYPLFLAITIGAFNQLAGINAILYYLNNIFAAAGFSKSRAISRQSRLAQQTFCLPSSACR
ncbi:MAG: MFS transporter [Terracidiphilus sp.]